MYCMNPPPAYLYFLAQAQQFLSEDDLKFYPFHDAQHPDLSYLYAALSLPLLNAAMPEEKMSKNVLYTGFLASLCRKVG